MEKERIDSLIDPKMPNILVLDDELHRHERFDELFAGANIKRVWSVDEAKLALRFGVRWDLVCLDNDLATENFMYEGRDVAVYIAMMPEDQRPKEVLIHSWNPGAAEWMEEHLTEAGMKPIRAEFGTFEAKVDEKGHIHISLGRKSRKVLAESKQQKEA